MFKMLQLYPQNKEFENCSKEFVLLSLKFLINVKIVIIVYIPFTQKILLFYLSLEQTEV